MHLCMRADNLHFDYPGKGETDCLISLQPHCAIKKPFVCSIQGFSVSAILEFST